AGPSGDRGEFLTTGYLGETAMAATKLVLAGILDESPGVRLVWSQPEWRPWPSCRPVWTGLTTLSDFAQTPELLSQAMFLRYRLHPWPGVGLRQSDVWC